MGNYPIKQERKRHSAKNSIDYRKNRNIFRKRTIGAFELRQQLTEALEDPQAYEEFESFITLCYVCHDQNVELLRRNEEIDPKKNTYMGLLLRNISL